MVVTKRTVITIGWVLVILTTALLFFKIQLNSNTLFLEDLARNILLYNGSWSNWQLTSTPAYIPDVALYFIAFKLLPLPVDRILFVTLAEALLVAACAIWLAKQIRAALSVTAEVAILALVALSSLVAAHSNMWLYFNTTNTQLSSLLFSLLALGFLIKYLVSNKNISLFKFLITILVAIICDQLFIIGFYSTAVILLAIFVLSIALKAKLAQLKKYEIPLLNTLIVTVMAYPIAKIMLYFIKYDHSKLNCDPLSYISIMQSLHIFKLAIINLIYPINVFIWLYVLLIILSLLTCVVLFARLFSFTMYPRKLGWLNPAIKIQFIGQADSSFTFCLFFLILLIPVNFIGVILSARFQDIYGLRYFMLPIALAFILTIVYLDERYSSDENTRVGEHLASSQRGFIYIVYASLAAIFVGVVLTLIQQLHYHGWQRLQSIRHQGIATSHHEAAIAACLQELQKAKTLHAGIANYWHGRGVALRLSDYVPILPLHSDLTPKMMMNTSEPYLDPAKYKINYDFIVIEKNGKLYNANAVSPFLPDGYEQHICANAPIEIWTYKNGILNDFLQAQILKSFFLNGKINHLMWPATLLKGKIGVITDTVRMAQTPHDKAGYLVNAFYLDLPPGYYRFTLAYSAKNNNPKQIAGTVSIGRFNAPIRNQLLFKQNLYSQDETMTAYILVPPKRYTVQEVRIWFAGHGSLAISSITVDRLSEI